MIETADPYCGILRMFDAFLNEEDQSAPPFTYNHDGEGLILLRNHTRLDKLKGDSGFFSHIVAVMAWIHEKFEYNGHTRQFPHLDGISLLAHANQKVDGLNCRMMATLLAESYLSLGYCARIVSLHGLSPFDNDNHVVVLVWWESARKWILMDPSFGQYYKSEEGLYLDPWELRVYLGQDRPVYCRDGDDECLITPKLKCYMAKNLFYMHSPLNNGFGCEMLPGQRWLVLHPNGFDAERRESLHLEWRRQHGRNTGQWIETFENHCRKMKSKHEQGAFIYTDSRYSFFKPPRGTTV